MEAHGITYHHAMALAVARRALQWQPESAGGGALASPLLVHLILVTSRG
jgi:hypothetical protein